MNTDETRIFDKKSAQLSAQLKKTLILNKIWLHALFKHDFYTNEMFFTIVF